MENHTLKPLFLKKEIQQRTVEVSNKISSDYKGRHPVLIGVLKGSFIFLADIIRQLTIEATIDFVQISSYGASKNSTENCLFKKDLCVDISGRDVLIVEDIIDTGNTIHFLIQQLLKKKPRSIKTCALINKKGRRKQKVPVDYYGFDIENEFIVGFGLDYNERFRALPGIFELIK